MQTDDIARLIMYVRAIYPSRAGNLNVDPMTIEAWADVLNGTEYTYAKQAVLSLNRTSKFMPDPGDIQREATAIVRRDVFGIAADGPAVFTDQLPQADPNDVTAYLEEIRANRARLIAGDIPTEHHTQAITAAEFNQQAQERGLPNLDDIGKMP